MNIEISLYEHQVGYRNYINGMFRKVGDFSEIDPMKSYYDLPSDMAGKIKFYKAEIENLNRKIQEWQ